MSAIYQDASLGANIKLVIARLLFYEHSKHGVVRPGNAKKSLENVNIWNRKLHAQLKPGQSRHDVAIWLTRYELFKMARFVTIRSICLDLALFSGIFVRNPVYTSVLLVVPR